MLLGSIVIALKDEPTLQSLNFYRLVHLRFKSMESIALYRIIQDRKSVHFS